MREDPVGLIAAVRHQLTNGIGLTVESLLHRRLTHVAAFGTHNAGDTLLPTVLRDLIQQKIGGIHWDPLHVHDLVNESEIRRMNRSDAVFIGGGGLFIRDSNRNDVSGWQWPVRTEDIEKIQAKLVVFAVGYNRFRGQDEFDDHFQSNIVKLVERASFVGLRNHGSIENIRSYLPAELREKVVFQPCMTTLLKHIYPEHFRIPPCEDGVVALNCAFDRASLRFGDRQNVILDRIAVAMKQISRYHRIAYFSHIESDKVMLPALERAAVPFEHVQLYNRPSTEVLERYRGVKLAIGMRGHSQMIPFGCGRPIISLISHNKLRWFLDDIEASDWGIEVDDPDLADRLVHLAGEVLDAAPEVTDRLKRAQTFLWDVTCANCERILKDIYS